MISEFWNFLPLDVMSRRLRKRVPVNRDVRWHFRGASPSVLMDRVEPVVVAGPSSSMQKPTSYRTLGPPRAGPAPLGAGPTSLQHLLNFASVERCTWPWAREDVSMSRPLYQLKAEFFKTLGHPARIRVLELLSEREHAVAEMLPEVGIEPANLSQQLAVLRRMGLVTTRKEGSSVFYSLTSPYVAELLAAARKILTGVLSGQVELLDDLRTPVPPVPPARVRRGSRSRGS
jgi:DNA-binding transcriptional ArsR family regulator